MVIITILHAILGRKSPLPKGTSPSLHCLTHWGDCVVSQRPLLRGKAAVLGACQLKWWSKKICQQRKHTTSSYSCCGCFLFSLSAYPLGIWSYTEGQEGWHMCEHMALSSWGNVHESIWSCPLTHQQTQERLCYTCYLGDFPYGSELFLKVNNLYLVSSKILSRCKEMS